MSEFRFSFQDAWRDSRRKSRLDRELLASVRAQASGKTRGEIGALVVAERLRRGMRSVPEPMLDLWIDAVIDDDPLSKARAHADAIATIARAGAGLVRMIRQHGSEEVAEARKADRSWLRPFAADLENAVLAEIDPDAQQYLETAARTATIRFRGLSGFKVALVPTAASQDGGDIVIELKGQAVGRIGSENAAAYWRIINEQADTSQEMDALALLNRGGDDGRLKFYVALPTERPLRRNTATGASETLWDRVNGADRYFRDHCLVCEKPCDQWEERSAMVSPTSGSGTRGMNGPVHEKCWERGARRARSEGLEWKDARASEDEK